MPHVSRKKLPEGTRKNIDNALLWVFSGLAGKEVELIFNSLLTPTERLMLAKRLGILFLLKEKMSETSIADTLKTTQTTVSRINLQHKLAPKESSHFLFRKLTNWQDFSLFKNALREVTLGLAKIFTRGMAGKI